MSPGRVEVLVVDEADREIGRCEKLEAHQRGVLHRAVSVFVFDGEGRLLVQQRAAGKYHSGGLWSNSACTHPRAGETLEASVERAVREELGAGIEALQYAFPFTYRADVGQGLVEHEYDHVFTAHLSGPLAPDPAEVTRVAWYSLGGLETAMEGTPAEFTPWFRLLLPLVASHRARA